MRKLIDGFGDLARAEVLLDARRDIPSLMIILAAFALGAFILLSCSYLFFGEHGFTVETAETLSKAISPAPFTYGLTTIVLIHTFWQGVLGPPSTNCTVRGQVYRVFMWPLLRAFSAYSCQTAALMLGILLFMTLTYGRTDMVVHMAIVPLVVLMGCFPLFFVATIINQGVLNEFRGRSFGLVVFTVTVGFVGLARVDFLGL